MSKLIEDISRIMDKANVLIKKRSFEEAYKEYREADINIESIKYTILLKTSKDEKQKIAEFYSSYAYFLFSCQEYSVFFEMYIKAQKYGYSHEKRRTFIYGAFIEPNIDSLRSNYIKNIENMQINGFIKKTIDFDELPYWLITTGKENEYYIYEKKTDLIKEKVLLDINYKSLICTDFYNLSSEYLIIDDNEGETIYKDISKVISTGKKIYIVTIYVQKILSYLQGFIIDEKLLNQITIFENNEEFKRHFINNSDYLPRTFVGYSDKQKEYAGLIEEIHKLRLNKQGRHGNRILLSICIPSYNRGQRAYDNVIHTLKSEFDEEIEIIVSNNGTQNNSKSYYEKISEMDDPRVTYFAFDKNEGYALNLCKAIDLAKGKYVLLLSDEDLVNLDELKFIINTLNSREYNISIVRTKTDGQGIVPYIGMKEQGKEALITFMLTSNYMSGIIFSNKLLSEYKMTEYIRNNLQNETCLCYPHMVWEIVLCQYGDVLGVDSILVNEGQAEKTEVETSSIGQSNKHIIPSYATVEGRLAQHRGFIEIIKELEISRSNFDILRELHMKVCRKTIHLVTLSIEVYYKQTDYNIREILEVTYNQMIESLNDIYKESKNSEKYWYARDIKEIGSYCGY